MLTPEQSKEKVSEVKKSPQERLRDMRAAIEAGRTQAKPREEVARSIRETMRKLDRKELERLVQEIQKGKAGDVLKDAADEDRLLMEKLAAEVAPAPMPKKPASPAPKEVWNDPDTWTEEHKKYAQWAVVGTAIMGGIALVAWVRSRIGSAKNAAKQAAQESGGGFFKKLFVGTMVFGAGLFAGRYMEQRYGQAQAAAPEVVAAPKPDPEVQDFEKRFAVIMDPVKYHHFSDWEKIEQELKALPVPKAAEGSPAAKEHAARLKDIEAVRALVKTYEAYAKRAQQITDTSEEANLPQRIKDMLNDAVNDVPNPNRVNEPVRGARLTYGQAWNVDTVMKAREKWDKTSKPLRDTVENMLSPE